MMKRFLPSALLAVLTLTGLTASAQAPAGPTPNWCGALAEQERYFAEHPGARDAQRLFNERMEALSKAQAMTQQRTNYVTDVTIPVVVHIIHGGGTDNISDRQIMSAIDQLNLDYQKLNPDTADIAPLFRPIAASVGFRFRLAKKDPNGNCTTGITRHYAPSIATDDGTGAIQSVSNWDRARYMNIWVVRGIASGAAGYVAPPNTPTNTRDGFTVLSTYFGTQGTGSLYVGRAATHEIGHYFGLSHTWGATNNPGTGDCTGTDYVSDTPTTDGIYSNCNLSYARCGPVANVQNFMDYSYCFRMFTQGQRTFMRNVLTNNRPLLTSQANLVFTGTNDGYVAPDCAPISAFAVQPGSNANVCINTPVTLRDYSTNFTATGGTLSYSWSFPGGTPATATGQTVSVSYPTAGFYSVTETVTNSIGSSTSTQTNIIRVEGPTGGETAPLTQSFEDVSFPNIYAAPTLRNYETNGLTAANAATTNYIWRRQAVFPAADGTAYLQVANRTYPVNVTSTLVTPNINLAGLSSATLSFARAYALRTSADNVQLRVSFSTDCGVTWSSPASFTAADLSTQGLTPNDGFVPATAADWQRLVVPIPAQYQGSGLFKARLQLVNGTTQGNTFFLDQLRVTSALAARAGAGAARGIAVYPNPRTHETAVHLTLDKAATVQLTLTDVLGRPVLALPAKAYGAGALALALPAGRPLTAGVYLVRVSLDGEVFTSKLTVE